MFLSLYSYDEASYDFSRKLLSSYLRKYSGCSSVYYDHQSQSGGEVVLLLKGLLDTSLISEHGIHKSGDSLVFVIVSPEVKDLPRDEFTVRLIKPGLSPYVSNSLSMELVHIQTGYSVYVYSSSHSGCLRIALPLLSSYVRVCVSLSLVSSYSGGSEDLPLP